MKNPLLSSFMIVTLFWYMVLAIFSPVLLHEIPVYALKGLGIVLVGVFWGVLALVVWLAVLRTNKQHDLKSGDRRRGLVISLGNFPRGAPPPARVPCGKIFLPVTYSAWFSAYQAAYPAHAGLMQAVMEIYLARAVLPASPVPGGHGGATLKQHSLNVLATILNMAPSWRYDGHKNKKGQIVFPLIDATFRFDATDPLIPIAGFAHDIGKITCYRERQDGLVEEVRPYHDTEGGKILITLDEFWALPKADRDALNLALSFYHHINSLPLWADDRTRALTELLIAADIRTGMAEGERNVAAMYEDIDTLPGWLDERTFEEGAAHSPLSIPDQTMAAIGGSEAIPAPGPAPAPVPVTPSQTSLASTSVDSAPADENEGWAWDQFEALLLEPGRINGNNKAMRVGFKHGEWVYVNDAGLRTALASALNTPRLTEQPGRGQMSPFTRLLLARLARSGLLYQHHDGLEFSEKSALFKMAMHGTGGKIVQNWGFTLIFKATALPAIAAMLDCKYPPQILGCGFGEHRAINKSGKPEFVESLQSSAAGKPGNGIPLDAEGIEGAIQALRLAMTSSDPPPFKDRTDQDGVWACFALNTLKSRVPLAGGWEVLVGCDLPQDDGARWVRGGSGLFLCLRIEEAIQQAQGAVEKGGFQEKGQ
jgi:hypothetical protein